MRRKSVGMMVIPSYASTDLMKPREFVACTRLGMVPGVTFGANRIEIRPHDKKNAENTFLENSTKE